MELTSSDVDQAVPCFNPECVDDTGHRSVAEPEQDGDHRYYACTVCGDEFGYQRPQPVQVSTGTCSVGIPETVRLAASAGMTHALAAQRETPLLQIGLRHANAS